MQDDSLDSLEDACSKDGISAEDAYILSSSIKRTVEDLVKQNRIPTKGFSKKRPIINAVPENEKAITRKQEKTIDNGIERGD